MISTGAGCAKTNLFVVIPTYNEAANIAELLTAVDQHAARASGLSRYQVIQVDDGSRDDTPAIVRRMSDRLPVHQIVHPENQGIGATFRDGLGFALEQAEDHDLVILLEGDLTNDPVLIPEMVKELHNGADVVIASRYRPGSAQPGFPARRRFLSYSLNWFLRRFHPIPGVRDYSIFYRGYRVALLRRAWECGGDDFIRCQGFGANAEILCRLRPFHPQIAEIPQIYRYDRAQGNSALKISQTIREYVRLFAALRSIAPPDAETPVSNRGVSADEAD